MSASSKALLIAGAGAGAWFALRAARRHRRYYDLRGKVVLITGASRGLGLVLAREFHEEGARLVICARNADELERARDELRQRGAEVLAVPGDVTEKEQVEEIIDKARGHFGRIDVLINNAGVIQVGPLEHMQVDDYERAMRTHFWAPLYTSLAMIPEMRRRREGRIVNISSIGGKISVPHLLPYDASKFALAGLSEGLRVELARDNVFVTTVCPGLIRTGSPRNAEFKGRHRAEYAWFSIGDALPLFTMSAERAARQIVGACKHGDAQIVLTLPAKLGVILHVLCPEFTADVLSIINWALPGPGGVGSRRVKGKDSYSSWSPSLLTLLNERAAWRNNEI
jgi:short-subunit dehydrogenase